MRFVAVIAVFCLITTLHAQDILGKQYLNELKRKQIEDGLNSIDNCITKISHELTKLKKDVQRLTCKEFKSCKEIFDNQRNNTASGVYEISDGSNQVMNVYCQMSSVSGCSGGGWTMVMKIDGNQSTFGYSSSHWTNKTTFNDNDYGRNGGFDNREFKESTYWKTSFNEVCVAMKYGGELRALSFSHPASSLYDLIADGIYCQTHVGRFQWKQLINGSSLQRKCNREGFNVNPRPGLNVRVRLGIVGNEQNHCNSADSFVGLGGEGGTSYLMRWCGSSFSLNTAGNLAQCSPDNGTKNLKAMGYILVR
ncbi:uncharacterized skeletal organic matrix protein 5-like isoform X1 [Dendronephthya gigantea]|uniref:uncharacterized skeletal organic matrix protein 5-like isoform X1 n=1 Tax=Dendronephthya gigantea TaxID=151771 RepID=UPI001069EF0F|nr:uncharacterized skeletal organic matrix protein 5-like isoform X1 [Dendronephthya gigantea]